MGEKASAYGVDVEELPVDPNRVELPAHNARAHGEAQIRKIMKSIEDFGFTTPIVLDGNRVVVAGSGRVIAARRLKMESIPAIICTGMGEAEARAFALADNRLAEMSSWDLDLLPGVLDGVSLDFINDFDLGRVLGPDRLKMVLPDVDLGGLLPTTADPPPAAPPAGGSPATTDAPPPPAPPPPTMPNPGDRVEHARKVADEPVLNHKWFSYTCPHCGHDGSVQMGSPQMVREGAS